MIRLMPCVIYIAYYNFYILSSSFGWGWRMHQLHLHREVRLSPMSILDMYKTFAFYRISHSFYVVSFTFYLVSKKNFAKSDGGAVEYPDCKD